MGRISKIVGELHEGWNEQQLIKAVYLGIVAHYHHNQPKARIIRGKWEPVERSVSDFTGVLESPSRFVDYPRWGAAASLAIEAKTVDGTRFYKNDVTSEQQAHLEAIARAGGLALLSISFRVSDGTHVKISRFIIPWLDIKWQMLRSQESINFEPSQDWLRHWEPWPECFLLRWHAGGPRSGIWLPKGAGKVYAAE